MFLHLGGDTMVSFEEIISIINAEHAMGANSTKEFLKQAARHERVERLDGDNYKSIIVTPTKVYLSPISSLTLKKRANFIDNLSTGI